MSTPSPSTNPRNTAIKRIQADVRELQRHPSSRYHAEPLEENIFEWHFTIRGPSGTDFDGGIYHGRILLPADYPFKPPNIIFLTKNGRFDVGTKICLSISAHHPEAWQPAWGVRTMLEAIISFLPTEGNGAIGALDWSPEERRKLAAESHAFSCPICGDIKDRLRPVGDGVEDALDAQIADQISQLHMHNVTDSPEAGSRKTSFVSDSGGTSASVPSTPLRGIGVGVGGGGDGGGVMGNEAEGDRVQEPQEMLFPLHEIVQNDPADIFDVADTTFIEREQEGRTAFNRVLIAAQYTSALIVFLLLVRRVLKNYPFLSDESTPEQSWDLWDL